MRPAMWRRIVLIALVFALEGLCHAPSGAGAAGNGEVQKPHRVVMHMNSGDEKVQRGTLNNIRHLYQEVGPERLQVELVAHGAGLSVFMKSATAFGKELTQLRADYGVNYTACSNTMKALKITRDDLIEEVADTVPAMVRLMERQEQGWAYIKP